MNGPNTRRRINQKAKVAVKVLRKSGNPIASYVMQCKILYQDGRRVDHSKTTWRRTVEESVSFSENHGGSLCVGCMVTIYM